MPQTEGGKKFRGGERAKIRATKFRPNITERGSKGYPRDFQAPPRLIPPPPLLPGFTAHFQIIKLYNIWLKNNEKIEKISFLLFYF